MALARVRTWNPGDTLTAADLNAEFNNILNNPTSLINLSAAGDVCIVSSAAAVTRLAIGTASQALTVSTGLLPVWSAAVLQSYLSGCQITAMAGTTSGTLTHSSGVAVDSTSNTTAMVLSSALVGTTTGTFIAGNNTGKLDTNSTGLASNQWYHIYVISSATGASPDILYSSSTSPTLPTGYSKQRRVGSFRTGSTANLISVVQDGDYFVYSTATILDTSVANPGTAAVTRTLTVPTGVTVLAILNVHVESTQGTGNDYWYLSDLSAPDEAPSLTAAPLGGLASGNATNENVGPALVRTNTSAQVRSRVNVSGPGSVLRIATLGWMDSRGRTA